MKMSILICLLISAGTASAQSAGPSHVPATDAQRAEVNERNHQRAIRDVYRDLFVGKITVSEALKRAGGNLSLDVGPGPDALYLPDIAAVTAQSSLVVSGRPQSARVRLSDNQSAVVTEYTILVDRVIRGTRTAKEATVTVEAPGGVMHFPEGTFEAKGGLVLNNAERYVLFLHPTTDRENTFVVTGLRGEGIFHVDEGIDGTHVRSMADRRDLPIAKDFEGKPVESLMLSISSAR